jgi:hypothetical protein
VYDAFLEITAEAPRELSGWINRLQPPGASPMVTLDLAYLGKAAQGEDLLARIDKIEGAISDGRGVRAGGTDLGEEGVAVEALVP